MIIIIIELWEGFIKSEMRCYVHLFRMSLTNFNLLFRNIMFDIIDYTYLQCILFNISASLMIIHDAL